MTRSLRATLASGLVALALVGCEAPALSSSATPAALSPASVTQEASGLAAPTNLQGSITDRRATLTWSPVAGLVRDYVIYDVSAGQPGRVVGRTTDTTWTSINLPGRPSFSFQVVARDVSKDEGARSETATVYHEGMPPTKPTEPPTEPTEPPTEPTEPTEPPVEPTEPPVEPTEPPTEPTEPPTEPTEPPTDPTEPPVEPTEPGDDGITLGVAVNPEFLAQGPYRDTVTDHFTGITSENGMKFRSLQPRRGEFTFGEADAVVNLALENGMQVRGHTLAWFGGNPSWVAQTPVSERAAILENHITTVVNHFEGRIAAWDVWNEAVADNGQGLRTDSPWNPQGTIEPVVAAFKAARAADANAALCVNEFSVEFNRAKVDAYYKFVTDLRASGAPVDCVGFQGHLMTETEAYADTRTDPGGWSPTQAEWQGIAQRFADIPGIDHIQLTEVDVRTNDTPESFTREQRDQAQALVVRNLAEGCAAVEDCDWVGFWNLRERDSWLGSEAEATLFTDSYQPKPAYFAARDGIVRD